ncbi:D-alanyl-D-alanine-carboxypeptidase/endopeptidase AmpH [Janthinobacterium fluminis]|uniref:D-alanyl-D-alanine-carboxypeptidase/endopeptidase AmpH n=1 Tax=Janthinobacterium fluminis TaxID=2987524 RepID=A0ABT5K5S7_9BURK|nr:D-alanyl-D-alanine-carboxypeptidase/endopeptidase AmpH [Janthinobacterium fluminis]MDC8760352.1 D-alanyl-D-alanine-carboxypeptidase/endopeptidase AmpH [Janthinobacterium fluminis]
MNATLLGCALLVAAGASAASPATNQQVDSAAALMFAATGAPGMVIAVVRDDSVIVRGYGESAAGSGRKPDGNSLLRINSTSKVLAAEAMVMLADEGKLRLSDPLQRYAEPGFKVPELSKHRPITLLSLATHTSGLARATDVAAPPHAAPNTWPDRAGRWGWLARQQPRTAPGEAALYSNVGFDLLADALAAAAGQPYTELLRERVTAPLGMHDTTATPNAGQCARLLGGAADGPTGPCSDTSATAGTAGMYSTANDMATWMQHLLGVRQAMPHALKAIAQAAYVQRQELASIEGLDQAGPASGMGLGWVHLAASAKAPGMLQKTGGGGGFMNYMVLVPGRKVGIFVAVTKADRPMAAEMARSANELAAALAPQ